MPVSLNNRRNTRIVETFADHPTRNTKVRQSVELIHHGSRTCTLTYDSHGGLYAVHVSTCGYDTVTTRGKINLFLATYARQLNMRLHRVAGRTVLTHFMSGQRESFDFCNSADFSNVGRSLAA